MPKIFFLDVFFGSSKRAGRASVVSVKQVCTVQQVNTHAKIVRTDASDFKIPHCWQGGH